LLFCEAEKPIIQQSKTSQTDFKAHKTMSSKNQKSNLVFYGMSSPQVERKQNCSFSEIEHTKHRFFGTEN
jgi:hypothetical protein